MASMRVAQVPGKGGNFEIVEKPIPEPGPGTVRIRVEACGICHSDAFVKEALFPGIEYPRAPGHEVAGVVDAVGQTVPTWQPGDRVGVGWHGGHCFTCTPCRQGDFITCENQQICGISYDGGYQEYVVVPAEAVARMPSDLAAIEAAPLLCAGVTTYNALRNSPARPGDVVAVQGIGGLGHLGVQFAHHMGFRTVALSRGEDKRELALQLGADDYIDTAAQDPGAALQAMGGARIALATAPSAAAVESLIGGLAINGQILLLAAFGDPIKVPPLALISGRRAVQGWPSGHAKDSEETLEFCARTGIRPMVETYPLAEVIRAYEQMITNRARFRVVLEVAGG
jgi:alcohol dehydrogenase/propanol-preferring alcohol dehydrogenase